MKLIYDILPVNNYQGNGVCDKFDFDFYIENKNQLKVYLFDENLIKIELVKDLDYSINEVGNKNGSYITFPIETSNYSILQNNQKLSLELDLKAHQLTQYNNSSLLNLSAIEYSFDYLTRLIQILKRKLELCVGVDEFSDSTPQELMDKLSNQANLAQQKALEASNDAKDVFEIKDELEQQAERINTIIEDLNNNIDDINDNINSRANLDLSNISSDAKKLISTYSAPSSTFTKLTIGASNTTYTMPANGYLVAIAKSKGFSGLSRIWLKCDWMQSRSASNHTSSGNVYANVCFIPVQKNNVITYEYNLAPTVEQHDLVFINAQGEI